MCRDLKMENIMLDESLRNIKLIGNTSLFALLLRRWRGVKYCNEYVCLLSVCLFVNSCNSKTTWPTSTKFSVYVTYGRGSILLWQRYDTLCTSGFVDDVIFSYNGAN